MKIFVKNLIFSILSSLFLMFVFSILLSVTNISENLINPITIGITSFSILLFAFNMSKNKKEKGIYFGSLLGLVYMLILYVISSCISLNFSLTIYSLIMIILGILGGAIGGILGVNF